MTKWEEARPIENCTKEIVSKFIYEKIITRIGCSITLISDQKTHLVNAAIDLMMKEFLVDHIENSPYHQQENGANEYLNNILAKGLTKMCNVNMVDWDDKVLEVLWAYITTYKNSNVKTSFKLVCR